MLQSASAAPPTRRSRRAAGTPQALPYRLPASCSGRAPGGAAWPAAGLKRPRHSRGLWRVSQAPGRRRRACPPANVAIMSHRLPHSRHTLICGTVCTKSSNTTDGKCKLPIESVLHRHSNFAGKSRWQYPNSMERVLTCSQANDHRYILSIFIPSATSKTQVFAFHAGN